MSTVKPFKALRPKPELASAVSELPYDVVTTKEARATFQKRPKSFFQVSRAEILFDDRQDPHDTVVYKKAHENLEKMIREGTLVKDKKDALYVYQLEFEGRIQTGIVGLCSIDEYEKKIIKKHELTRQDKEDDRVKHIEFCQAQTGLVFLTYRDEHELKASVYQLIKGKSPEVEFSTHDKVTHRVWSIGDDRDKKVLMDKFSDVPSLYIADGHHRAQAAWRAGRNQLSLNAKYFMAGIFAADELKIYPYFRILKNNLKLKFEDVKRKCSAFSFASAPKSPYQPNRRHIFGLFAEGQWYEMKPKPEIIVEKNAIKSLDVYILQEHFLKPVFGISDPRTDKNIDFMGGIKGVSGLERECREHGAWGISLYATSIEEVMRVSDQDLIMPPKSTWFEPKLRSGLFINQF